MWASKHNRLAIDRKQDLAGSRFGELGGEFFDDADRELDSIIRFRASLDANRSFDAIHPQPCQPPMRSLADRPMERVQQFVPPAPFLVWH